MLGRNLQGLLRILLTRAYSAFYLYACELVALVYETRLAHLVIFDAELGQLLSKSVREHVADLTRAGQKDRLYGEFKDRLGVPFFENATDRNRERVIAELRHDIEHNQARISARLVRNVQHCSAYRTVDTGNPIILDANQVVTDLAFFQRLVSDADERAAAKFQLPRMVFYLPPDMANQG